jgi:Xaa-Pro aminopeptidase
MKLFLRASIFAFFIAAQVVSAQPPNVQFTYEYPYQDGIPAQRFRERRQRILNTYTDKSIFIAFSADIRNRQNDVDYPFKQNSNFWYLTGMPDPECVLILAPGGIEIDGKKEYEILFVQPRRKEKEVWTGVAMGPDEAMQYLGIAKAIEYSRLRQILNAALKGIDTLYFGTLPTARLQIPLLEKPVQAEQEIRKEIQNIYPDLYIKPAQALLSKLREIKDADEIRLMRKAVDISIKGHIQAMQKARPGMKEYQIEAEMEHGFHSHGAEDVGYPSIVGASYNGCILHYITNKKTTADGDLILADCGAEYQNYTADITRTFPVNGKFSPEQKIIYDIVLEAQDSAFSQCKVGNTFRAPHNAAQEVISKRLKELGIISESAQVRWYFMHGTSHYLGLDVHDPGTGGDLKPNSIITIEPGIYIPPGSPCDKKWWNIGIRIEDDILIRAEGPENLSSALPRRSEEIEKLMHNGRHGNKD